jgi:2'-5' RNA ligase
MSLIRAFIAIDLSQAVSQQLEEIVRQLKTRFPGKAVRWVAVKNIHLTIKFMGDISPANLRTLEQTLQSEASRFAVFSFHVGGLGAFPSIRRPRVVWVGVQAPDELAGLQRSVEKALERLGYPAEGRAFSPHLTLGRVGRNITPDELGRLSQALETLPVGQLGTVQAQAIHLIRSDLRPDGPLYTRLYSAALAQN